MKFRSPHAPDRILAACRAAGFKNKLDAGLHIKAQLSAGASARDVARAMNLTVQDVHRLATMAARAHATPTGVQVSGVA